MKIKNFTSFGGGGQFWAMYACEFCGHQKVGSGYDDDNFYKHVVPAMTCPACEKSSDGASSLKRVATDACSG